MSGPKTSQYEIQRNLELERRALDLALTQLRAFDSQFRSLVLSAEETRRRFVNDQIVIQIPPFITINPNSPRDEIERQIIQLRAACDALDAEIKGAVATVETRRMLASLATRTAGRGISAAEVLKTTAKAKTKQLSPEELARQDAEERRQRKAVIERIAGRAASVMSPQLRKDLENLAGEILATNSQDQAVLWTDELRLRVQRVTDDLKARRTEVAKASEQLCKLRGLGGIEAHEAIRELEAVERHETRMTDELLQRVEQAYNTAKMQADGEYAAQVTGSVLAELGYEVEDTDLATLFVTGGRVHFQKPEWRDYWVRLKIDPNEGMINFNVVRVKDDMNQRAESDQRVRDREIEEQWCPDHGQVLDAMEKSGIACETVRRLPPGAVAVQTIEPSVDLASTQRRERKQPKSMQKKLPTPNT